MIGINAVLGGIGGIPGHAASTYSCYYPQVTAVEIDPLKEATGQDLLDQTTGESDLISDLQDPTNDSNTGEGDGTPLDSFTQTAEILARSVDLIKNFLTGGYVVNTLGNLVIGCDITCDEALIDTVDDGVDHPTQCDIHGTASFSYDYNPATNDIWVMFSWGIQLVVLTLLAYTLLTLVVGPRFQLGN